MSPVIVPVTVDPERSGGIDATFSSTVAGVTREGSGSLWLQATKDGGVTQGSPSVDAQLKAISHDNPTQAGRARAVRELAKAPASEVRVTAATASPSSNEIEIHGNARWADWNGVTHPARHITVKITDQDFFSGPAQLGQVVTDDSGYYTFSWTYTDPFPTERDYQVEFLAESDTASVGRLGLGDFGGYGPYYRWVSAANVPLGSTRQVDVTVGHNGPEIATFIRTRATKAKTEAEAANVTIKNIKRAGRGYCSPENCRCKDHALQRRPDGGVTTQLAQSRHAESPRPSKARLWMWSSPRVDSPKMPA